MDIWHKGSLEYPNVSDQKEALEEYFSLILSACSSETSSDEGNWNSENPLHGHCAVVALLVQENFGGHFLRASLEDMKGYEQMRSHYWNLLPNGSEVDLTAGQFRGQDRELIPPGSVVNQETRLITREGLLSNDLTRKRYELLKIRLDEKISEFLKNQRDE